MRLRCSLVWISIGYTGPRPRLQLWHGTNDQTLDYQNFLEALKQWSNVLNLSSTCENPNTPEQGYTEKVYGDGTQLVGYSAQGVSHSIPEHEELTLAFFGLIESKGSEKGVSVGSLIFGGE